MIYLTGAFRKDQAAQLIALGVGVMLQPGNAFHRNLETLGFPCWAADNGCYAQGEAFSLERFYDWLERLPRSRLLFAVAPDVFGNAEATLARSRQPLHDLANMGIPPAFVLQNGAQDTAIPWDDFAWLFIGGDDEWKLGPYVRDLVEQGKRRGKQVHMGRVNSEMRLRYAHSIGCDACDGTFLKFRNRAGNGADALTKWFTQTLLPYVLPR